MLHCSGDIDANVPVTTTRYAINRLKLPIETAWRPWYFENEVRIIQFSFAVSNNLGVVKKCI